MSLYCFAQYAVMWSDEENKTKQDVNYDVCRLKNKDVFALIQKHSLYTALSDQIKPLMALDSEQATKLLLDNVDKIPVSCRHLTSWFLTQITVKKTLKKNKKEVVTQ